nr:YheC/YheD family protein [Neobacillus sp. Marseille-Q6967]
MVFIQYKENKNTIDIPPKLIKQYNIHSKRIILKIGGLSRELTVNIKENMPENTIFIPTFGNELTIPEEIPYELVMNGRVLSLGPVIAFVVYSSIKDLNPKRLERLKGRFSEYQTIKGLIYICAVKGINTEKRQIEGYYYNPSGKDANSRWSYGVFPYPDVVYKRHPIDTNRYNDLVSQIGDRVINSYYFCKGELPGYVSNNEEIKHLFPETQRLLGAAQLNQMLKRYQSVYLKPPKGEGGRGILNVTLNEQGSYVFVDQKDTINIIADQTELTLYLKKFISRKYIIQQSVATSIHGRNVDLRVYAQKNGLKQWECQGMIGRLAKKDKIVTNLKYVEKLLSGKEALMYLFGFHHQKAVELQTKIYESCIKVCKELDKSVGNFGDVAIDCIVDQNYQVWILEINKRYGYDSLIKMKNYKLRSTLFTTPFRYAKALAGF